MLTKLTDRELWIVSSAFSDLAIDMEEADCETTSDISIYNLEEFKEKLLKKYKLEGIQLDVYVTGANPFTEKEHKDDTISG